MRQPHETATQPVQLVPAAEAITCSEHVVLQHFLRCMVLVLHFLHTHWWEILLHRSTTAAFTSSLIGMCHHSSIHKQPHWYVSPQQHPQAASLVCVTTAAFTSSLIGMCHHSSIHKQPHWHVSPQQHSAPYLVPGILLQGGVIGLAKSRWGWGRGLWWRQVQVTHWHVLGLAGRVGTSSQQLPHLLIAGLHQDEGL
jgi:hypothetical protein